MHTREIDAYGGLVNRMPAYALVFMLFTMANVGLPGTAGFVGEFLTLMGMFQVNTWVAAVATTGVILSAAYALWLYRRVVLGDLIKESLKSITDMDRAREVDLRAAGGDDAAARRLSGAGDRRHRAVSAEALIENYQFGRARRPDRRQRPRTTRTETPCRFRPSRSSCPS